MFFDDKKSKVDQAHRTDLDKSQILLKSRQEREKRQLTKNQALAATTVQSKLRGYLACKKLHSQLSKDDLPKIVHEVVVVLNKLPEQQIQKVISQVLTKIIHKVNCFLRASQRINSKNSIHLDFFTDLSHFVTKA